MGYGVILKYFFVQCNFWIDVSNISINEERKSVVLFLDKTYRGNSFGVNCQFGNRGNFA